MPTQRCKLGDCSKARTCPRWQGGFETRGGNEVIDHPPATAPSPLVVLLQNDNSNQALRPPPRGLRSGSVPHAASQRPSTHSGRKQNRHAPLDGVHGNLQHGSPSCPSVRGNYIQKCVLVCSFPRTGALLLGSCVNSVGPFLLQMGNSQSVRLSQRFKFSGATLRAHGAREILSGHLRILTWYTGSACHCLSRKRGQGARIA